MSKNLVDAHSFSGNGQGVVSYIQGLYTEILKSNDKNLEVTFACKDVEKIKEIFPNANLYLAA